MTGARLRYRTTTLATAGSTGSHTISLGDNTWTESGLTWNNRPAITGPSLGALPPGSVPDTAYTTGLSAGVLSTRLGTTVTVAIYGSAHDSVWFWSRSHATASYRPQLTLTFT